MIDSRLIKLRAVYNMRKALHEFNTNHDESQANLFYGSALAYEEVYDMMQPNPDANGLYMHDETYRELCRQWGLRRATDPTPADFPIPTAGT